MLCRVSARGCLTGFSTIRWVVGIIGLLVLSASYALSIVDPYREVKANMQKWRSHGSTNYQMRFKMDYYCCDMNGRRRAGRSMLVDVRRGRVHSATYEDDGTPVPVHVVHSDEVHSIDSLFIDMVAGYPSILHADYNPEFGYPEFMAVIPDPSAGPELHYWIELLETMEENINVSEMVSVPAGTFRMGDLSGAGDDDELPVRSVTVPAFRLGKYEVTFGEWDACVADGGCEDYGWGHGIWPVRAVSWYEVQSFIDWLNQKTGSNYRLPTEAEWEYAARAGTTTEYSWGDDIGSNRANCSNDYCGDSWDYTAPVGSFPANPWGLHDMHGNVDEWVQDCWNDNYEGAPTDGSAWTSGDCSLRVVRGGSWDLNAWALRSAARFWYGRAGRNADALGFRLAQDE